MDNRYKFINLKTFEISDTPGDFIMVDAEIVDIVAILNSKGYQTYASCAGHNKMVFTETLECSKDDFNKYLAKEPSVKIMEETEDKIFYKSECLGMNTYIAFKEDYDFSFIPEGFSYDNEKNLIYRMINFYNGKQRRKDKDIEDELKNNWYILNKWALELKPLKEKER